MKLSLIPVLVAMAAASSSPVAASPRCRNVVNGAAIRVQQRPFGQDIPDGDRSAYPTATTSVTCRIGAGGRLEECRTPLADLRGPWLVRQLRSWRVLDKRLDGCPLIGRRVRFNFRLMMQGDS